VQTFCGHKFWLLIGHNLPNWPPFWKISFCTDDSQAEQAGDYEAESLLAPGSKCGAQVEKGAGHNMSRPNLFEFYENTSLTVLFLHFSF